MFDTLRNNEFFCTFKRLLDLCLVPLICSFLLKILLPDRVNLSKVLFLITPTLFLLVLHSITSNEVALVLSFLYTGLLILVIFVLIVIFSIRYDRYLKNNFSNIDNMAVRWVRVIMFIFIAWYVFWAFVVRLDNRWLDSIYYLFLILCWSTIYKYSTRHVSAFQSKELFRAEPEESRTVVEPDVVNNKIKVLLEVHMKKDKPWLNPTLTLSELAAMLGTNRTYLSEYFNKVECMSFYDYLNRHRVEYACKLLSSGSKQPLLLISEQSGFNSLSTFRRAFEKQKGCSPAKYRALLDSGKM